MKISILPILLLLLSSFGSYAQKKVVEVATTTKLNLALPPGSKQDNRIISTASAAMLLELVSQKAGTGIRNAEVYYIPKIAEGISPEWLQQSLSAKGYEVKEIQDEPKYFWVLKGKESFLLYLAPEKDETNLYIGECLQNPNLNAASNQMTMENAPKPQQANLPSRAEPSTTSVSPSPAGWHFTTTHFNDGWSATQEADWVRVVKGDVTVLLHFGIPFDDAMRMDALGECWKRIGESRYEVLRKNVHLPGTFDDRFYYMEMDVLEKRTGARRFIGFSVVPINGVAHCVEAVTPGNDLFKREFPSRERLEAMLQSNRFAVHPDDLVGTWSSFGSSAVSLYNIYTGGFAGMNMTATSDDFIFEKNGAYSSRHAGASSMYGGTQFFDNKYNGQTSVGNWEVALSNRLEGKTESFHAHFEAVRGGRILYLQNKQYPGIVYKLVKIK